MTAVEFSPQERATLARMERAEPAPESLRERMAEAIAASFAKQLANGYVDRGQCYAAADAALAVIKGDPS